MSLDLNDTPPQRRDDPVDEKELTERLRERAPEWVPLLFPRGRATLDGKEWRCANIHGAPPKKEGSFKVNLVGNNAGDWYEFDNNKGGGPMSTIKEATGLSGADLWERAREYAGMPLRHSVPARSQRSNVDRSLDVAFILKCCAPAAGTLVETYLNSRGLDLPPTEDIKFHSLMTDYTIKTAPIGRPGMVAVVRRPDTNEPTGGVHRTYLAEDGQGKAEDMPKPKMMLGPCEEGVVMLMPLGADGSLGIGEGLESSLAAHKIFGVPTWAALSTSGMRSFVFPPGLKRLAIFADHGDGGVAAAWHLHGRAQMQGIEAVVNLPRSDDDFAKDLALGLEPLPAQEVIPPPRGLNDLLALARSLPRPCETKLLTNILRGIVLARLVPTEKSQVIDAIRRQTGTKAADLNEMLIVARREVGARALISGDRPWIDKIAVWDNGQPKPTLANALVPLREDQELIGLIGHNEFSEAPVLLRMPPYDCGERQINLPQAWTDDDTRRLTEWMQACGLNATTPIVKEAVLTIARDQYIHPVRERLETLEWDGIKRIEQWLQMHAGAADTAYTRAIGSRYLISAIARVYNPGCKVDCALILEGDQGIGKSTLLRMLFDPWFTDDIADFGTKDAAMQLRGVWGVELSELDVLGRVEVARVKSWIGRTDDHYRPPYGESVIDVPRQCVFCGSTNENEYLRDPTGGRRFWPIKCNKMKIDFKAFFAVKDQLWAEALSDFRSGARYDIYEPELQTEASQQQAERLEGDVWDPIITDYLRRKFPANAWRSEDDLYDITRMGDILEFAINMEKDRWTQREKNRVGRYMKANGWERHQIREHGIQVWVYRRLHRQPEPV